MGNDGFEDSGFDSLFDDGGFDSAGFGDDGGFDNSDESSTSSGFDSFDSGDGDSEGFSGAKAQNNGGASISEDDLGNAFDNSLEDNTETPESRNEHGGLKKQAIIMVVVGVVALLLVIAIASAVGRHSSNNTVNPNNNGVNNNVVAQTPDNSANTRVDISDNNDYSSSNNTSNNSTNNNDASTSNDENSVKYVQDENMFNWVEITNNENVQIEDNYSDMTFTVTGLKFYARSVDTNNNLVIKCVVSGSVSGLSGTYTLDVPYNKGVRLVVGNSFTVHVQLGTYNGKTVVCDMKY